MKKVLLLMVAVMLIVGVMAGPALAVDGAEQGAKGYDDFYLNAASKSFDNPGKMFQWIRENRDMNPVQWINYWAEHGNWEGNLGHFIYTRGELVP